MALPQTLAPLVPAGTDSPAQGDNELRGIKQYVIDVLGVPDNQAVTAAAFAVTTAGVVTVSQTPLTVPSMLQGPASGLLVIRAGYSAINFQVPSGLLVGSITATGLLWNTRYLETASGVTMVLGTVGAQSFNVRTNSLDRWTIDASGMLLATTDNVFDIGASAANRPRSLYLGGAIVPAAVSGTPAQHALFRENVIKGWARVTTAGGVPSLVDSFNVTSITDVGTGRLTTTWDRDFATANYVVVGMGSSSQASASQRVIQVDTSVAQAAGAVDLFCLNATPALADPADWFILAIGDQ